LLLEGLWQEDLDASIAHLMTKVVQQTGDQIEASFKRAAGDGESEGLLTRYALSTLPTPRLRDLHPLVYVATVACAIGRTELAARTGFLF
jgi:hypothetical protein